MKTLTDKYPNAEAVAAIKVGDVVELPSPINAIPLPVVHTAKTKTEGMVIFSVEWAGIELPEVYLSKAGLIGVDLLKPLAPDVPALEISHVPHTLYVIADLFGTDILHKGAIHTGDIKPDADCAFIAPKGFKITVQYLKDKVFFASLNLMGQATVGVAQNSKGKLYMVVFERAMGMFKEAVVDMTTILNTIKPLYTYTFNDKTAKWELSDVDNLVQGLR